MRSLLVLVIIALVAHTASAAPSFAGSADAPVAAPLADAPAAPAAPAVKALIKPAIDVAAAMNPATKPSFRPVEPVMVSTTAVSGDAPLLGAKPGNLKSPIIYAAPAAAAAADADAPSTGVAPANLVKAAVSKNIFGGAVVFKRAIDEKGCPCKKQVPEKFRYDAQYKPAPVAVSVKCCCKDPAPAAPDAHLPPIIAKLKKEPVPVAAPAPCLKAPEPVKVTVAPAYYPHKLSAKKLAAAAAKLAAGCAKPAPVVPGTVTPSFYPSKLSRKERKALGQVVMKPKA